MQRFGRVEVRRGERRLLVDGAPVALGARAFDLLLALVDARERVVSKAELLDLVWPGLVVEENNLQVQVSTLRKLLGPGAIATAPGRGYRFTLDGPDPAPPAPAASPTQPAPVPALPPDRDRFLGREAELQFGAQALAATRLLSLVAIGGSGKTRLALALARRMQPQFRDGAAFVDLAPLQSAEGLWPALAAAIGWRETRGEPLPDGVTAQLRDSELLIVLDNCETLPEATAALADRLLARCPGLTLLATSRRRLGVTGERVWPLPPLGLPESDDPQALLRSDAVRLFVERAAAARPGFVLDPSQAPAVARLCRALDGLPLALELAAARLALLDVNALLERLDRRFQLLAGSGDPRHARLASVLAWSVEQLTPADRIRLGRLSVFAGGWTLGMARVVLGDDDEIELLDALARLHALALVVADAADTGEPRQHLLDTVRHYAADLLAQDPEVEAVRLRHVQVCTEAGVAIAQALRTGRPRAVERLQAELANMRAAHEHCATLADDATLGFRLLAALADGCLIAGRPGLALDLLQEALARPAARAQTEQRAQALLDVGRLGYFAFRYPVAEAALHESLALADTLGRPMLRARALARLADLAWPGGDLALAHRRAVEAVALVRAHGAAADQGWLGNFLNALGNSARWVGRLEESERAYEEARSLADPSAVHSVVTTVNLVITRLTRGNDRGVRELLQEVARVQQRAGVALADKNLMRGGCAWAMFRAQWHWALVLMGAEQALARRTGFQLDRGAYVLAHEARARASLGKAEADAAIAEGEAADPQALFARLRDWIDGPPADVTPT